MIDWKVWIEEVKRLSEHPPKLEHPVLRDAFDLYSEGCSPKEAVALLDHHTILEKPACR